MPSVAEVSRQEWVRNPVSAAGDQSVSNNVPARNEEETIEPALKTLLALDYDNYEVIAVNDRSTDSTGAITWSRSREKPPLLAKRTREMGRPNSSPLLRVVHHRELPAGWLGKTHAMWTAANHATGDWLLFTDADVLFKPDSLRRALAYAESVPDDHVVLFPQMIIKRPGEYMMIAFQTMFVFGHRPWKVADPSTDDHMGVGAFNLVRRRVYEAVGTYEALRMEVLDDMKLGKVVKKAGFAQRNVFGGDLISIRWAKGAMGVVNNLTKKFLRGSFLPVVAHVDFGVRIGLPEFWAVSRHLSGTWLGAGALRDRAGVDVFHLHWNVLAVGSAGVLLPAASGEHGAVHLHAFAVDDSHFVE